jgi:hypothetical protein
LIDKPTVHAKSGVLLLAAQENAVSICTNYRYFGIRLVHPASLLTTDAGTGALAQSAAGHRSVAMDQQKPARIPSRWRAWFLRSGAK